MKWKAEHSCQGSNSFPADSQYFDVQTENALKKKLISVILHTIQKIWSVGNVFCPPRLHLIDQKYSYNCEMLLQFKIIYYIATCNLFQRLTLYFQHHYSSLQCHMIFRNHTDLLLKKHLWLLSMLKTVVLLNIFGETDAFYISRLFDE